MGNIIPIGGAYYVGVKNSKNYLSKATKVYRPGEEFPSIIRDGDIYTYGDYEYRYNKVYTLDGWRPRVLNGWNVRVQNDKQRYYGEILSSINGKNVVSMDYTFAFCHSLIESPKIPNTILTMKETFVYCESLIKSPYIPDGVTKMSGAFWFCHSLKGNVYVPSSVNDSHYIFDSKKGNPVIVRSNFKIFENNENQNFNNDVNFDKVVVPDFYNYDDIVDSVFNTNQNNDEIIDNNVKIKEECNSDNNHPDLSIRVVYNDESKKNNNIEIKKVENEISNTVVIENTFEDCELLNDIENINSIDNIKLKKEEYMNNKQVSDVDFNKIYEIYKNRLLDISGKNKLVSFKLSAKGIDLYDFNEFNVLDLLNDEKFYIREDDYIDYFVEKNEEQSEDFDLDEFKKELSLKFRKYLKILSSLVKENSANYREAGKYTLYLSYYFLSGKLYGDNVLKIFAPLFLIPVEIDVSHSSFKINRTNEDILINRTILVAMQKTLKRKLDLKSYEISNLNELSLEDLILKIEELEIKINRNLEFKKFPNKPVEIISDKFELFNHFVLSNLCISNSIFNDYVEMNSDANKSLELLLDDDLILNLDERRLEKEFKNIDITNRELSLISKLDTSQELAVYMAKKSNNLVIYGPPGTGKSETILNIISDNVKNNKKVLVVSEKKTAINVLYNRLMGLQKISLMFDRSNLNLSEVKENILTKIQPFSFVKEDIDLKESLNNIEDCYKYFDDIYNVLNIEFNGRKISEWYGEGKIDFEKDLSVIENLEYSISKNKNIQKFFDFYYSDFMNFLEKVTDKELINTYKFVKDSEDRLKFIKSLFDNNIVAKDLIFRLYSLKEKRDIYLEKINKIERLNLNKENILKELNALPDINFLKQNISFLKNDLSKNEELKENLKNNEKEFNFLLNAIDNIYNLSNLSNFNKKFKDVFIKNKLIDDCLIDDINVYIELRREYFNNSNGFIKRYFNKSKNEEIKNNFSIQKNKIVEKINKYIENINIEINDKEILISNYKTDIENKKNELKFNVEKINSLTSELNNLKNTKEEVSKSINSEINGFLDLGKICGDVSELIKSSEDIDSFVEIANIYKNNREKLKDLIIVNGDLLEFFDYLKEENLIDSDELRNLLWSVYLKMQIDQIELFYDDRINNIKKYNFIHEDYLNHESYYFKNIINDILISSLSKRDNININKEYLRLEKKFQKELGINRRVKLRQFMDVYFEVIQNYFPIILATPDTISKYFPLIKDCFDVVIFDEASQLVIENSLPSIYRSKKVIVVGDDKQLKPSSYFKSNISIEDEALMSSDEKITEDEMLFLPDSLTLLSLLDIAKTKYNSVSLLFHYRSKYAELINFSNVVFYKNQLRLGPNVSRDSLNNAIDYIRVNGKNENHCNEIEAKKVVELLKNIFKNRKNNETIGIITFNIQQKACIEEEIEKEMLSDPNFNSIYLKEASRVDKFEDESIFVKNIENVQGDERDIIIFSVGYSYNDKGRIPTNFGPLSLEGGENRLNVAVSRAKSKVYVISSFEPEHLDVEGCKNEGSRIFKDYLLYAKYISEKRQEDVSNLLNKYCSSINVIENQKFDSPFEEQVYKELVNMGYIVDTQIGCYGFRIDMGIYDEKKGKYILGIECDGATYHSSKNVKERDLARQAFLESRGWNIHRIWSAYWWKDQKSILNKIKDIVDNCK